MERHTHMASQALLATGQTLLLSVARSYRVIRGGRFRLSIPGSGQWGVGLIAAILSCLLRVGPVPAQDGVVSPVDLDALSVARDIYQANCAMCHGFDGIPMMQGTPNFANGERLEETDNQLLESIRKGKGTMPSWAKILDEQERAAVLAYTRMILGDGLFLEHCESCHSQSVPVLADRIPKSREKLNTHDGSWDLCASYPIEQMMAREDIITLIRFLRDVARRELKGQAVGTEG